MSIEYLTTRIVEADVKFQASRWGWDGDVNRGFADSNGTWLGPGPGFERHDFYGRPNDVHHEPGEPDYILRFNDNHPLGNPVPGVPIFDAATYYYNEAQPRWEDFFTGWDDADMCYPENFYDMADELDAAAEQIAIDYDGDNVIKTLNVDLKTRLDDILDFFKEQGGDTMITFRQDVLRPMPYTIRGLYASTMLLQAAARGSMNIWSDAMMGRTNLANKIVKALDAGAPGDDVPWHEIFQVVKAFTDLGGLIPGPQQPYVKAASGVLGPLDTLVSMVDGKPPEPIEFQADDPQGVCDKAKKARDALGRAIQEREQRLDEQLSDATSDINSSLTSTAGTEANFKLKPIKLLQITDNDDLRITSWDDLGTYARRTLPEVAGFLGTAASGVGNANVIKAHWDRNDRITPGWAGPGASFVGLWNLTIDLLKDLEWDIRKSADTLEIAAGYIKGSDHQVAHDNAKIDQQLKQNAAHLPDERPGGTKS